jgi:hypothetical protein
VDRTNTDSYGSPIDVGDFVAYNRSGDVKCGWVKFVPPKPHQGAVIIVERDSGKESIVRNRQGILILEKKDV